MFTDEDLKKWLDLHHALKLVARLEAAENVCIGAIPLGSIILKEALEAWRKSAGKE